jgi:hypothetical protein
VSDASSAKAYAASTVHTETPLQEAFGVFCDPQLVRRWHEAKARRVYYIGPQRIWATGEIHQVKRRDPAAEAAQAAASGALVADFRSRLRNGELEATGIPHPSADGRRAPIPAALWAVLKIDWRRGIVWDGLAQKPPQGDQIWRDLRVRRKEPAPDDVHRGSDAGVAELPVSRATAAAGRAARDASHVRPASKLEACVKLRLDHGDRPGDTVHWKTFCNRGASTTRHPPILLDPSAGLTQDF